MWPGTSGASAGTEVLVRRPPGTCCRAPPWEQWWTEPLPWEADTRAHQVFLSEWITWRYDCHLIGQGSAALGSQVQKPSVPVLEMHFLKTQTHTSIPPPAGNVRANAHLAHLACCLWRVCSGNSPLNFLTGLQFASWPIACVC